MSEMIAYCGLDCSKCDAFIATQAGNIAQKEKIAERWSRELNMEFTSEDITCDGCKSERLSRWCQNVCKVRPCAVGNGVSTCANCNAYACENLNEILSDEPEAKAVLDEIRKLYSGRYTL